MRTASLGPECITLRIAVGARAHLVGTGWRFCARGAENSRSRPPLPPGAPDPPGRSRTIGATAQALEHMKTLLHKAGTNTRHLLKVNIYLSDIRTVDACHRAWEQFFAAQAMGDEERPVRITHQTVLKEQSYRVEVHAEAVLPADK